MAAPVPSPCRNILDQKFDRVWHFIKFLTHSFHRAGRAPRAASARAATCTATNGGEPLASARAGRNRVATTEATPRHSRPGTGAWMTCTRCARPRRACTRLAVPRRTPTCRDIPEATGRRGGPPFRPEKPRHAAGALNRGILGECPDLSWFEANGTKQ